LNPAKSAGFNFSQRHITSYLRAFLQLAVQLLLHHLGVGAPLGCAHDLPEQPAPDSLLSAQVLTHLLGIRLEHLLDQLSHPAGL
jgi:hypothetical protein